MLEDLISVISGLKLRFVEFNDIRDREGNVVPAIMITHGQFNVFVIDEGNSLRVRMPFTPPPEIAQKLAELPDEAFQRMMMVINIELLQGRTGYGVEAKDKVINNLYVEQKLVFEKECLDCVQRFLDAIQEIVVTGSRAINVMGNIVGSLEGQPLSTTSSFHETMYF